MRLSSFHDLDAHFPELASALLARSELDEDDIRINTCVISPNPSDSNHFVFPLEFGRLVATHNLDRHSPTSFKRKTAGFVGGLFVREDGDSDPFWTLCWSR